MRKWHRYTQEFKDQAVKRLKGCTPEWAIAFNRLPRNVLPNSVQKPTLLNRCRDGSFSWSCGLMFDEAASLGTTTRETVSKPICVCAGPLS